MTENNIDGLFQKMKELEIEEKIKAALEELAEKKEEEFKLERGDTYWVVGGNGESIVQEWDGYPYGNSALRNNAIFKTQEEAEFEAERLKVLRELEKMGRGFIFDENNWSIFLNGDYELVSYSDCDYHEEFGPYYFDTEEEAKKAIDKIGAERIKKYLFGIELRGEPNE